ncbi:unnamed protein product [Moneuplotes crassus]|uniref:Uncharacterized protein n=1 Tax=Euplotes crassus TaxID=5936 RepID=A0AAD2D7N0_EUPCR|nr:unnamed protein product [Moneuplotes crassus]
MNSALFDYNQEISILSTCYNNTEKAAKCLKRRRKVQTKESALLSTRYSSLPPKGDRKKMQSSRSLVKTARTHEVHRRISGGLQHQDGRKISRVSQRAKLSVKRLGMALTKTKLRPKQRKHTPQKKQSGPKINITDLSTPSRNHLLPGLSIFTHSNPTNSSSTHKEHSDPYSTQFKLQKIQKSKNQCSQNSNLESKSTNSFSRAYIPSSNALLARLCGKPAKAFLTTQLKKSREKGNQASEKELRENDRVVDLSEAEINSSCVKMKKLLGRIDRVSTIPKTPTRTSKSIPPRSAKVCVRRRVRVYDKPIDV